MIEILDNFDYNRVCVAMHFLNWKYLGEDHTPTVEELKKRSITEIIACANKAIEYYDTFVTECGGFRVKVDLNGNIELLFILTSWNSGD